MIAAMTSFSRAAAGLLAAAASLAAVSSLAQAPVAPSLDDFGLLVATQSRPSFTVLGAGARAAGMGGAFTALADDASAASFNPAGLALLLVPEASAVFDGSQRHDEHAAFTDVEGGAVEDYGASSSTFTTAGLNFASFTVPLTVARRNLCLQLSFHRVIDFGFHTDRGFAQTDAAGAPLADLRQRVDQSGDVSTFSLAAAYQLTQRLSLGATVSRWSGAWSFDTRTEERTAGAAETTALRFRQDNEWSGWNVGAGFLLRYRYLNVGGAYRSEFAGDYRVQSRLDTTFATPYAPASTFSGTLTWPNSYTLGIAVKPLETWFLTADYAELDWDDMVIGGLGADGAQQVNFFDLRPKEETTTRNTVQWRFGSEYTMFPGDDVVAVRAGYFIEPRPQLLSPHDEQSSVTGWSLGAGWRRGPFTVDLAFQHSSGTSRILEFVDPETVATGVVSSQAEGRLDADRDRLFVSFLYQFNSRDVLRDVFHFLFVGPLDRKGANGEGGGGEPEPAAAGGDAEAPGARGGGSSAGGLRR